MAAPTRAPPRCRPARCPRARCASPTWGTRLRVGFCLAVLAAIAAEGSSFLSRMHHTTAVFTPAGQRTRLLDLLGPEPSYDLAVQLGCTQRLPARLLAVRVPPAVAAARRRGLKATARKHGRTPTAESLAWADWTLLVTNAGADRLSLPEALVLVRAGYPRTGGATGAALQALEAAWPDR